MSEPASPDAGPAPKPARAGLRRAFHWILALVALTFVAYVVPIRDRCEDPSSPKTQVAVTREADACVLHVRSGDVRIPRAQCDGLRCEPGLATTLSHAKLFAVLGLLALYLAGNVAWAARWRLLLSLAGVEMSLWRVLRVSIEAQAGGILLPGGIGGDALRIASVMGAPHKGGGKTPGSIVVASVMLDRAVGLSTLGIVAAVLGLAMGGGGVGGPAQYVLASFPFAFVLGLLVLRSDALSRVGLLTRGRIGRAVTPVLEYVRDPGALRAIGKSLLASVLVSATQFLVVRGLVYALGGVPTSETWIYFGAAMVFIVSAVPALPGGWGTGDAAYVFFLGFAGISPSIALAVCLVYRLFWYSTGAAGAVLHLVGRSRRAEEPRRS